MGRFLRFTILGAFLSGQGFASLDLASESDAQHSLSTGHVMPVSCHEPDLMAPKFAALSLDGGQGTGYVQTLILSALDEEFQKHLGVAPETPDKDKPRIIEAFDFVQDDATNAFHAGHHVLHEVIQREPALAHYGILFVSIGIRPFVPAAGPLSWVRHVVNQSLHGPALAHNALIKTPFRSGDSDHPGGYIRWSPQLSEDIDPSDTRPQNLALLRQIALDFIQERHADITQTAQKLAWRYQVKMGLRAAY